MVRSRDFEVQGEPAVDPTDSGMLEDSGYVVLWYGRQPGVPSFVVLRRAQAAAGDAVVAADGPAVPLQDDGQAVATIFANELTSALTAAAGRGGN